MVCRTLNAVWLILLGGFGDVEVVGTGGGVGIVGRAFRRALRALGALAILRGNRLWGLAWGGGLLRGSTGV